MILTGTEIRKQVKAGAITISPYAESQLSTNSYDFRLGLEILQYRDLELDTAAENETTRQDIPAEGMLLTPERIYLGHTAETMGSNHFVPIIRAKSSIARLGLFVHVTADLIDIGSINQWTLQLHAVQPILIYAGMLIGQVTFWVPHGDIDLYDGKYQGSRGPTASKSHHEFDGNK